MKTSILYLLSPLIVILALQVAEGQNVGFRFLATGDVPYSSDHEVRYRRLLSQAAQEDFAFLMHVGDIKDGSAPCSDAALLTIRDLFHDYPRPVVYSIGDNEWTDCHSPGENPIERLAKLREFFFKDETVLRLDQLEAKHQSANAEFAPFIENYCFTKSGVMFVVVHVCGSSNNRRTEDPASMEEFANRNAANVAFLKDSLEQAVTQQALGVAIVIHANPDFEKGRNQGFADTLAEFRSFLGNYQKPVVCIHGDSHYFRIDKPLRDESGKPYLHFTRMEVFGHPTVAGVVVHVEPATPHVFRFMPYFLQEE